MTENNREMCEEDNFFIRGIELHHNCLLKRSNAVRRKREDLKLPLIKIESFEDVTTEK